MPREGVSSTCSSSHAAGGCRWLRTGPICSSGAGPEVCGAWLSPLGAAGIKDTSSAFFFVFHLLRPFIASTVWGCTSWPAPLLAAPVEPLSIPLAPGAAGESNTAFLGMEMLSGAG